jgi:hypothetical protein
VSDLQSASGSTLAFQTNSALTFGGTNDLHYIDTTTGAYVRALPMQCAEAAPPVEQFWNVGATHGSIAGAVILGLALVITRTITRMRRMDWIDKQVGQ